MNEPSKCPECGSFLPATSLYGLCPKCLLSEVSPALGEEGAEQRAEGPNTIGGVSIPLSVGERVGDLIGRYKLLQRIGEGGCGVVYLAEQQQPVRRRVALKVIKLGMDTREVVARFEAERQAMALMDHPHIAKVLDCGATSTGRPFFVMELVRGIPITLYCDESRLETAQRLKLFILICRAIQHAHQKGIIHRDIKPTNVLVANEDRAAVPKVIDFGIAKATAGQALTDKTLFTAFEQFLGTPAYVSPEQAISGSDIDTRSDIYSLGVLLYELLTGTPPFEPRRLARVGIEEVCRISREEEPPRPSIRLSTLGLGELTTLADRRQTEGPKLRAVLRGDLDWIVMKCLEKDRTRRYQTADALAMDILRYLNHEPILARPATKWYRVRKIVRRNKLAFLAGVSLFAALVGGLVFMGWESRARSRAYVRVKAAEERAEQAKNVQIRMREQAEKSAAQLAEALARLELQTAEESFNNGNPAKGLAHLALVLRHNPNNAAAAARTLAALDQSSFSIALTRPLPHRDQVRSAQFSPDGKRVVTASFDGTARVWDVATAQPLTAPLKHQGWVDWAQFSPDGRFVVTASRDHTARIWDANTGQSIGAPLFHDGSVFDAEFNPDGQLVATASEDKTARVWDSRTGRPVSLPLAHPGAVSRVQFSPDGGQLLTAARDGAARIWDVRTGQLITDAVKCDSPLRSAQFSPDGRFLLTVSWVTADLWDARTGRRLAPPLRHEAIVGSARFSPNGRLVATGSDDDNARVWDATTGLPLTPPLRHQDEVWCVTFSPDSRWLATGSRDKAVRLWDAMTGRPVTSPIALGYEVRSVQFSPDGRLFLATAGDAARLWNLSAGWLRSQSLDHADVVVSAEVSPDGTRVITASMDKTARVWDANTGKPLSEPLRHPDAVIWAEFQSDGRRFLTVSGNAVLIWDLASSAPARTLDHEAPVVTAHFSHDGLNVVTASGTCARVWDANTGLPLSPPLRHQVVVRSAEFSPDGSRIITVAGSLVTCWATNGVNVSQPVFQHDDDVWSAHFSPDGTRILTACADKCARIWDARTGRPILSSIRHGGNIFSAQFSYDGRKVVTASADKTARVWDAETGRPLTPPLKHADLVVSAEFTRDGSRVATSCLDKAARVWDARTGQVLTGPFKHSEELCSIRFSPDGQQLITASKDHTARIWDVQSVTLPVPDWVVDLAEAIAEERLDDQGNFEVVEPSKLLLLKDQVAASSATDVWTHAAKRFFAVAEGKAEGN